MRSHWARWVAAIIFLIAASVSSPAQAAPAARGAQPALVVAIADGDTLTVLQGRRQIKVRLAGIDAPEKSQAYGRAARQSLATLCLRQHAELRVEDKDRYGRLVARVRCNGVDANQTQVERGMAWVHPRYNKDFELLLAEFEAKSARRGLWGDRRPVPPWEWRRQKR